MCLAVPGLVRSVSDDEPLLRTAIVDFGGVTREVNLACVPDAVPGDYVLVHAGIALSRMDEKEALQVLGCLQEMEAAHENGGQA